MFLITSAGYDSDIKDDRTSLLRFSSKLSRWSFVLRRARRRSRYFRSGKLTARLSGLGGYTDKEEYATNDEGSLSRA